MSAALILASETIPVGRGVRAYFAPVDRVSGVPTVFDPAGAFDLEDPPAPWIDLGWVAKFERTPQTAVHVVRTGEAGGVAAQYRTGLDAQVACEFTNWGKLPMALAGGSVHFNVLASEGTIAQACGGPAVRAKVLLAGSSASELLLDAEALADFAAGDLVAVDVDYRGETGYVGTGIASGYVRVGDGVARDLDFTRRVTFNVARVAEKTAMSLKLAEPLLGGVPAVNAGVQKVVGFVDREGGSFFQEWSAVFVMPEDSGGRIGFYYPRLQAMSGAREGEREIARPIVARTLRAAFRAMPMVDAMDGEACVCWRWYWPSVG